MTNEPPLLVRLYLDEDVHKRVAAALRLRNFDVVSAHELGKWALGDEEQLTYALQERRTIFSYNSADFVRLHLDWLRGGREHCGIIVSDQIPIGETIRRLLNLLNRVTADEMANQLMWLQAFRETAV
jgi:predicted nuclease of predicted toxin-antitoxin system